MTIQKQKNINIQFNNGVFLAINEKVGDTKNIILSFTGDYKSNNSEDIIILNSGEYESSGLLIKVSINNNVFISAEGVKSTIVNDYKNLEKDNANLYSDILIFDSSLIFDIAPSEISEIEKKIEPKLIVLSKILAKEDFPKAEKVNKIKLKSSDFELMNETKLYTL